MQPVDPQVIAQRMVFSLQEERSDFMSYYYKFRFAFPAAHDPVIEQAEERQRHLLTQLLAGKAAYELYHPYPVALPLFSMPSSRSLSKASAHRVTDHRNA